jgi:hypothetical protein
LAAAIATNEPVSAMSNRNSAAARGRPLPKFLTIDQRTQVYFPSEKVHKEADGSIQKAEKDADLAAVRRLFARFRKFTEEIAPGFQIIVTEHANLRDEWFQSALIEKPWSKPPWRQIIGLMNRAIDGDHRPICWSGADPSTSR